MSDSKINKDDYSSDEEDKVQEVSKSNIHDDSDGDVDAEYMPQLSDNSSNKNNDDSLQEDDNEAIGLIVEERKRNPFEIKNNISGEIENHIEEFKQVIKRHQIPDVYSNNTKTPAGTSLVSSSEHDICEENEKQIEDNYEVFLKEMSETENQINKLKIYNNSFNREMSSKYEGYQIESEDDYDGNYEPDHAASNSSEGNLSRDEIANDDDDEDNEEEEKKLEPVVDSIRHELLQVSPDSPIEGLSNHNKHIEKMFEDMLFRDVINEYEENKRHLSMMVRKEDEKASNKDKIERLIKRSSERVTKNEN